MRVLFAIALFCLIACAEKSEKDAQVKKNASRSILKRDTQPNKKVDSTIFKGAPLIGMWFTPHAANHNIYFRDSKSFEYDSGSEVPILGEYQIEGDSIYLRFPKKEYRDLALFLKNEKSSIGPEIVNRYLINEKEEEYFVEQGKVE